MICTFFGHRDTPSNVEPVLQSLLIDLIENRGATTFYVGNNGNFDLLAGKQLELLKHKYPHIDYFVVVSSISPKNNTFTHENLLFPDILENTPPKYAISKRNNRMLNQADYVVTYVKYISGGAYKIKKTALNKKKTVFELSELM